MQPFLDSQAVGTVYQGTARPCLQAAKFSSPEAEISPPPLPPANFLIGSTIENRQPNLFANGPAMNLARSSAAANLLPMARYWCPGETVLAEISNPGAEPTCPDCPARYGPLRLRARENPLFSASPLAVNCFWWL